METLLGVLNWVLANYQAVLTAVVAILSGVIAIAMLIPGKEPESTLQKIVNFIEKFSKK